MVPGVVVNVGRVRLQRHGPREVLGGPREVAARAEEVAPRDLNEPQVLSRAVLLRLAQGLQRVLITS